MQGKAAHDTRGTGIPGPQSPHAPGAQDSIPAEDSAWGRTAVLASLLFACTAPFSIFLSQVAVWLALALCCIRPRLAFRPLRNHPWLGQALAFYLLIQGISVIYSQDPLRSLICFRGDWPVLFLPIFLGILQVRRARRWGLTALLIAAGISGLLGLWQHLSGVDPLGHSVLEACHAGRFLAVGSLGGHLTYGGTQMLAFAASLALLVAGQRRHRPLWMICTACTAMGLLASYARTAWIGAAAAALIVAVAGAWLSQPDTAGRVRSRLRTLAPAVLVLCAALLIVVLTPELRERLFSMTRFTQLPRIRLWATALRIFDAFPLFGAGLGSFKSLFDLFSLDGIYWATGHPHSDALNALVHSGLAGALAFVALWVAVLRACSCGARRVLGYAVVTAFLVAGIAQCYFTDEEPAGFLWFLLAAAILESGAPGTPKRNSVSSHPNHPRPAPVSPPRLSLQRRMERRVKRALLPAAIRLFPPRPTARITDLTAARRILLVRQDQRLGNLLLLTPFLRALRRLAPQAEITLLVGDRFAALFEEAPWIDRLILERKRWLIRHPFAYPSHLAQIARGKWDIAFELSNPDTHSFYNVFLTVASRAPLRIGFDHSRSRAALNALIPPPEMECHFSLAPLLLLSALGASPELLPMKIVPAPDKTGAVTDPGLAAPVVIHPGGRGGKRWPAARYAALVRQLAASQSRRIVVLGGPAEGDLITEVAAHAGATVRSVRLDSLEALISLLRGASLYLGCDAGPAHLAAALGLPTITLFLQSHPLRYAALGPEHEAILMGERSRELARTPQFQAASEPGTSSLRWEPAFARSLAGLRPRMAIPPAALDPAGEVAFVLDRIRQALAEDPAAARRTMA